MFFVTRMKTGAHFGVEQQEPIFVPQGKVVGDRRIRSSRAHDLCPCSAKLLFLRQTS